MGRDAGYDGKARKKARAVDREYTSALFYLRCAELGLSHDDLREMTVGMATDMLIEKHNDEHDYPYMATQGDIDRLMGG